MILVKNRYLSQNLSLSRDSLCYLTIENQNMYRSFLLGIQRQQKEEEEGYLLVYRDEKEVKVNKEVCLLTDILNFEFDEKKAALAIQKDVGTKVDRQKFEKYELLLNAISDFIDEVSYDYQLPLTYDSEMTLPAFLKAFSLNVDSSSDSFLSMLVQKIKILTFVFHYSIFIFVNLCDFLSKEELIFFKKEMNLLEVDFLIISSHLPNYRINHEQIIRIDSDLCELDVDLENQKN